MQRTDCQEYYNHHAERIHLRRQEAAKANEMFPFLQELSPGSRVLDWGCGSGIDVGILTRFGHKATGLDFSAPMIAIARQENTNQEFLVKNGLMFTPAASELDGVWINETLNDLSFEQAQRVVGSSFHGLKDHGLLGIIVEEGDGSYEDRSDDLYGPSRVIYRYREKALCPMIEQSGFTVLKVGRSKQLFPNQAQKILILARRLNRTV